MVIILVLSGTAINAVAQTNKTVKPTKVGPEEAYCTATGGLVEVRYAVYGTNNSQPNWLPLAGVEPFCQYTLAAPGVADSCFGGHVVHDQADPCGACVLSAHALERSGKWEPGIILLCAAGRGRNWRYRSCRLRSGCNQRRNPRGLDVSGQFDD